MTSSTLSLVKTTLGLALTLTLATACAPLQKAAPPVSSLHLSAHVDKVKLQQGRDLYASSCTHCHGPARIDKHGDDEKWRHHILPSMCAKAKLTPAQSDWLTYYVLTARQAMQTSATP